MLAWRERALGWFGGDADSISQWRPSFNGSSKNSQGIATFHNDG